MDYLRSKRKQNDILIESDYPRIKKTKDKARIKESLKKRS